MANVKPVPEGYPRVSPYLCVDGAAAAIDFYTKVFGAKERMRMPAPGGKIGHAEIKIGDSVIMLADESPEQDFLSPKARGGTSVLLHLYVPNVDNFVAKAIAAGAQLVRPVTDQFYGDRAGGIKDPFGHSWYVATHKEELSPAEIKKRAAEYMKKSGS